MSEAAAVVTVPVEALKPHPDNPRRGDVPAIMRSLERFGQVKPIIVQKSTGYVVAGNHTLQAAKRLGWPTIRIQLQDMDDATARAYLIADNKTSDRGSYHTDQLDDLLAGELGNLNGTGWTDEEVEERIADSMREPGEKRERKIGGAGDREIDEASKNYDPFRQISIAIPLSQMEHFTRQISELQKHWGVRTTVEVVRKVVDIAYEALPQPEEGFKAAPASTEF